MAREPKGGFALGSGGAFLVIESRAHAEARGAKPFARLPSVVADLSHRKRPATSPRRWNSCGPSSARFPTRRRSSPARPAPNRSPPRNAPSCARIRDFRCAPPARCSATSWNASSRSGIALAALSVSRGALFPPNDPTGLEIETSETADPDCRDRRRPLARRRHGAGGSHQLNRRRSDHDRYAR